MSSKLYNITYLSERYPRLDLFFKSFYASLIGIAASYLLFPNETSVISIFLTSFTLLQAINRLFYLNRQEIWENIITPYQANKKLTIYLIIVFIGIMLGYACVTIFLKPETARILLDRQLGIYKGIRQGFGLGDINFGSLLQLIKHNLNVLLIVLLFAIFFRAGGILLIISWNASSWGVIFSYITRNIIQSYGIGKGVLSFIIIYCSVFLHLIAESSGYILCAMAGTFISRGTVRYFNDTQKFIRVAKAAVLIFILSLVCIFLAAFIESILTPKIIGVLASLTT